MNLTASDVASLSESLSRWEIGEYICAGFVTIACAGEYVAEFTNWFTGGIKERKERLAKRSTLLLIVALSLELICLVRTNILSGMLIGSLSEKAEEADRKAKAALGNSAAAMSSAHEAGIAAGNAQQKADNVAMQAQALMQNLGLTQLLFSARSVNNLNNLIEQLKQFKGQAVTVRSYVADGEGYFLCKSIYFAVHSAEMNSTDECGTVGATFPPATEIVIYGPDVQETVSLGGMISRTGRLGVASGIKAPTLTIFVGIKSPFTIGQAPPVKAPSTNKNKK
jgi:hypothetical protein